MATPRLELRSPQTARLTPAFGQSLGQVLVGRGVLTHQELMRALDIAQRVEAPLAHVCLTESLATPHQILHAQAERFAAIALTLQDDEPDPECLALIDGVTCLEMGICPWMRLGNSLVVATSDPETFDALRAGLEEKLGDVIMGVATSDDIQMAVAQGHGAEMAVRAENDLPDAYSCRNLHILASRTQMIWAVGAAVLIGAVAFVMPGLFFGALAVWAVLTLAMIAGMKVVALVARLTAPPEPGIPPEAEITGPLPQVSVLVPLFHERDIAGALIERLSRLTYPKTHLETLLVLEADDQQTQETLDRTELPPWMRVITVPPGNLQTKPRAMNYARRFARGEIIGIYDAEDAPAPDQIEKFVSHFQRAPPEVGCLQGILDFYNPRMNWLARCFTIEYAAWFRVLLPGLSRAGMPIPLGGTTVFFRREVLEDVHGWDAHNVTEDADLGMRLARSGYRTELTGTVTLEEANCHLWPWVRQRSRWLKGYMVTYLVHMRSPARLWRELGPGRFFGFQVFFLASLSQFALAPLLWSCWLVVFGLPHPVLDRLSDGWFLGLSGLFLLAELIGLTMGMVAVSSPRHRHLTAWVPTLLFYFPLAALATYKALWELVRNPFYWDKTSHGLSLDSTTVDH